MAPPTDDDFATRLQDRVCRDVIFLILFVAFVVGTIAFMVYVGVKSNPKRLIHGYDRYGNVCGQNNKKYFNLSNSGQNFTSKPYLSFGVSTAEGLAKGEVMLGTCVNNCSPNSSTLIGYLCLPLSSSSISNKTNAISAILFGVSISSFFRNAGRDLQATWKEMLIMCVIALVFAIVITILLRLLAQVVVWLSVIIMIGGSIGGTIYLWVLKTQQSKQLQAMMNSTSSSPYEIQMMQQRVQSLLIGAIVATICSVLLLIILIAMRNRIRLVIALFKEAGRAVAAMPLILFQPVWTFIWMALVCALWVLGWIIIETSGQPMLYNNSVVFVISDFIKYMRLYHLFAILWITQFILACQDVTIAGAVSHWYFTRNKKELGWPISSSMRAMFRYHLGSIALGSLIIAIVKFIRIMLKYLEKKLNRNGNQICSFLLKCCQCCLWCFEKFLKFLSRNAYIEIAIYGYGFCKAAQKAFGVLASNALRVAAINSVGAFVLFLAKSSVVICTVVIGYQLLKTRNEVMYVWVPLLIVALFAYFTAHCFISVYDMTIDTLFLCFCEDCEMNDGIQKPYYMSINLMKFVENSKKAMDALENHNKEGDKSRPWTTDVQPSNTQMNYPMSAPPSRMHSGIKPLQPGYPPNSLPPSPRHFLSSTN